MRVLFSAKRLGEYGRLLQRLLPEHEIAVRSQGDMASDARDADVILPAGPLTREIMAGSRVRLIQSIGAGYDLVDIAVASELGIYVANVPSTATLNADGTAELGVFHMLALARNYPEAQESIRSGRWRVGLGRALCESTVAILGFGGVGQAVARKLSGFGCRLHVISRRGPRSARDLPAVDFHGGPEDQQKVLAEADFAVITIPLSEQTRGYFGRAEFQALKPNSFLVNLSRGGVVDTDALIEALESGQLAGAGLDVFSPEPISMDHPLFQYNVVATPHIGGHVSGSLDAIFERIAENVRRLASGQMPAYCLNLDAIREPRRP